LFAPDEMVGDSILWSKWRKKGRNFNEKQSYLLYITVSFMPYITDVKI
jgi:hypothetical protein